MRTGLATSLLKKPGLDVDDYKNSTDPSPVAYSGGGGLCLPPFQLTIIFMMVYLAVLLMFFLQNIKI